MATIKVKGKEVYLADEIVEAGADTIRMALAASFPDAATMEFEVVGRQAPAVVTERRTTVSTASRATTKG
jgi:hypothetical protein